MRIACPCCGAPITGSGLPLEMLGELALTGQHRRILDALVSRYPRAVTSETLFDYLYFDDPAGGPDNPRAVVAVRICRLRRRLEPLGWTVTGRNPGGYGRNGGYRLAQVGEAAP